METRLPRKAVTLVTSAPFRAISSQPSATAVSIARCLDGCGRLGRVVCPDFDPDGTGISASHLTTPASRLLHAAAGTALARALRVFPLAQRRLEEELFDRLLSRRSDLLEAETLLFLKPLFPSSAARARRLGATVVALATIHHPAFNMARVVAEQQLRGVAGTSSYTDRKRVGNITRFLDSVDFLLSRAPGSERTYVEHGFPPERILSVGETGVDCETFRPDPVARPPSRLRVLHVSHMNLIKGLGYLFEAWRNADLQGAELVLGGSIDDAVRSLLSEFDPPNVVLLGSLSDPRRAYQEADVVVCPSISDMGPSTVLESMASGTPVIVSDACGASGIIASGRDGFVYRYDDVAGLGATLRWCAENRVRLAEMRFEARATALRHPRSDFGNRVVAAIDEVQGRSGRETRP
jgi:glycosyltransferase involved in cell wall biosynthesis